jgi:hypothetical protein
MMQYCYCHYLLIVMKSFEVVRIVMKCSALGPWSSLLVADQFLVSKVVSLSVFVRLEMLERK